MSYSVWVHIGNGHYVGSAAVVIAKTEAEAKGLIRDALDSSGLKSEELDVERFELESQLVYFSDGDY